MVWRHPHQPCLDQRLSDFRLSRRYATSLSFLQNPPLHIWPHPIHHPLAIDFNRLNHPPTPVHQRLLPLCDLKHGSVGCLCRMILANKCLSIPDICHRRHGHTRVNFFLAGVNFYRFNAKSWQFTMYFAIITQKNGNLLCILS